MTKIAFRHRRIAEMADVLDLVEMLFPGNLNQQHAAARILRALKSSSDLVSSLGYLEKDFRLSRRTLQRTRAKLANLGLIEYVSWMNCRYAGQSGWKLSTRFPAALRRLADKVDHWKSDHRKELQRKEDLLISLFQS